MKTFDIFFLTLLLTINFSSFSAAQEPEAKNIENCDGSIKHGPFEVSLDQSKDDKGELKLTMNDGTTIKGKFFKNEKGQSIGCFYDIQKSKKEKFKIHSPVYPEETCTANEIKYLTKENYEKNCQQNSSSPCWSKYESVMIVPGQGLIFYSFDGKETKKIKRTDLSAALDACSKNKIKQTPAKDLTSPGSATQR